MNRIILFFILTFSIANAFTQNHDDYIKHGIDKFNAGDFNGAIVDFNDALHLNPKSAVGYYNRGNANEALNYFELAIKDFDMAIKLNPKAIEAYLNRGETRVRMKQYENAIKDFTTAIEIQPDCINAYYNRAVVKNTLKDTAGACKDFTKAAQLGDKDAAEMARSLCK